MVDNTEEMSQGTQWIIARQTVSKQAIKVECDECHAKGKKGVVGELLRGPLTQPEPRKMDSFLEGVKFQKWCSNILDKSKAVMEQVC